jgi:hypothetical protein
LQHKDIFRKSQDTFNAGPPYDDNPAFNDAENEF